MRGGGAGDANGLWEAGEQVTFTLTVDNDGSDPLTGLSATVVPLTPGVVMLDASAEIGDVAAGQSGATLVPHVTALLPHGLLCADEVQFQLDIDADEGSWTSSFEQTVGEVLAGGGTALDENFETGALPAAWTVVDGSADGNTWYADDSGDPAGCGNTDPGAPIAGTWAAVDSDCTGSGVSMDEALVSPLLDLTGAITVTLEFDHWFRRYQEELADVDVRSSLTGGQWVNVARWTACRPATPRTSRST